MKAFYKIILSAGLLALSRLPIGLGLLVFFAFLPLFSFHKNRHSKKQILLYAFIFSVVYNLIALHWISLVTIGGFIGMFFLFGAYFFVLFLLYNFVSQRIPKLRFPAFIFFWISFEYLQNFGEFRFPWFNLGYSLADYNALIQPVEIGGMYLLALLILIVNILLYNLKIHFKRSFTALFVIFLVWSGWGIFRYKTIPVEQTNTNISIVQVSIPQDKKWETSYLDSTLALYEIYTQKAAEGKPDMIIWPEAAMPGYVIRNNMFRNFVGGMAKEVQTEVFTGFPHYEVAPKDYPEKFKFFNSATKITKEGKFKPIYRKNILVPFGERIPFLNVFPVLWKLDFGQANWEYGTEQSIYKINEFSFSPLICFEIAFDSLGKKIADKNVDFIVNLTNDAWFHRSDGTYQHLMMTKFRAIETRTQIYRAANTGFSAIVSPKGEILKQTGLFKKEIISEQLYIYNGNSFFTKYMFWFPLVFVFGAVLMFVVSLFKRRSTLIKI